MRFKAVCTSLFLCLASATAFAGTVGLSADALLAPGAVQSGDYTIGPTSPGKWGASGIGTPGGTVTYSFMGAGISTEEGSTFDLGTYFPLGWQAEVAAAFASWSAVANIQFALVADSGLPFNDPLATSGDIRIGLTNLGGPGGTLAHGYFPPANGTTAAGDIHFDVNEIWTIGGVGSGFGTIGGYDLRTVMAHEIGHAIGLDHSSVANSLMNLFYQTQYNSPQADDIAGAQYLYGVVAVPLPSSSALGGVGLVMMIGGFLVRRRRAAA